MSQAQLSDPEIGLLGNSCPAPHCKANLASPDYAFLPSIVGRGETQATERDSATISKLQAYGAVYSHASGYAARTARVALQLRPSRKCDKEANFHSRRLSVN
jgi:hypothetical protein